MPWANITLPPHTKLPITLCPLESPFGCHFVSQSMNIRHSLGPIPRIMYWRCTNMTIFMKLPGQSLQAGKKKGEMIFIPQENECRENLLPDALAPPWAKQRSSGFATELWTPRSYFLVSPLPSKAGTKNVTSITSTLEIRMPLGFIYIFSVGSVRSSQRPLILESKNN